MLRKLAASFAYAGSGIAAVWKEELNFKVQVAIAVLVILFMIVFNFSVAEAVPVIFAIAFVLVIESINTAVEDLCNKIEPRMDPAIGKIKNIMAGAVLMGAIGSIVAGVMIVLHHFNYFW